MVMSKSTKSVEVTFWRIEIGQFLYTHRAIIDSLTRVEIEKGSDKILGLTPK